MHHISGGSVQGTTTTDLAKRYSRIFICEQLLASISVVTTKFKMDKSEICSKFGALGKGNFSAGTSSHEKQ